jgi:hypothetical protein
MALLALVEMVVAVAVVSPRRQLMLATVVQVEQVLVEVEVLALMALAPAMHRVLVAQVETPK